MARENKIYCLVEKGTNNKYSGYAPNGVRTRLSVMFEDWEQLCSDEDEKLELDIVSYDFKTSITKRLDYEDLMEIYNYKKRKG